jgi:glycosyltransferase involved in cell wall biosynthesis
MELCIVSSKECWQDASGAWCSYGGFPRQMHAVASLFDEVTMVIVRGKPRSGGMPLPREARVVALREPAGREWRRKLFVLAALPYYVSIMGRSMHRHAVVHIPLPGDLPLVGFVTALLLRKRCIARYCGSWTTNAETTLTNKITRACMRRVAGGRNVMLATGEHEHPPAPRMHWTFATVLSREELDALHPCLNRGLSQPPHLVYVGRLSPEKGVIGLIRALALLKARGATPMPHVTLVGDGPARSGLERAARELNCEDAITFVGQLPREALVHVLYGADICVQPSLTEGFSKAWLDAMALGLPVISSDVGAARSVIGEAEERGWLVKAGDVNQLADTIQHVIADASIDWPALRRRCRDQVRNRTLDMWTEQIGRLCAQQWGGRVTEGKLES